MVYSRRGSIGFSFLLLCVVFLTSCLSRPEKRGYAASAKPSSSDNGKANRGSLLANYAELLGVREKDLDNVELYSFIDEWIGAPHRLGGQAKSGIDCSAFISQLYTQVYDKNLPRASYEMAEEVKRKYENQLVEGDLVFFSFGKERVDHVGLYLRNNKFIHVSTSKGVMISDLHESWFYKYFVRGGTIK